MRRVALVSADPEGTAALAWLDTLPEVRAARFDRLAEVPLEVTDLVWAHGSEAPAGAAGLRDWLAAGGRLLASLDAVAIPHALGLEPVPPDDVVQRVWRHEEDELQLENFRSFRRFPHVRGLAGFGPHPLFAGLHQGTYTWAPADGEPYRARTYRTARPGAGAVVAVERSFIHLNPGRVVAWEHAVGDGGILCLGAFIHLAARDDLLARQLRALLANAVTGDAVPHADRALPVAVWPVPGSAARQDIQVPVPAEPQLGAEWGGDAPSVVATDQPVTADDPWTHAGRRILLAGGEQGGLREAWTHPFRLLGRAALTVAGGHTATSFRADPEAVSRRLAAGDRWVRERWRSALELPVLLWEVECQGTPEVTLAWRIDLRRMWPYPAGACGDLRWNISEDCRRLWCGTDGASFQGFFSVRGGAIVEVADVSGPGDPALEVRVQAPGSVMVVAVGAVDATDLATTLRGLERKRQAGLGNQRAQHTALLQRYAAGLETPDPGLDQAFEWAKVRCDGFIAETPGVGRSLLAGYAASRPGWGDGRPGYGWYFGRDACWTALAQLATGDREGPRDVLKFLSQTQDVTGKVIHEFTTSGLAHYDAADSTPLYLLLAGRFAAWTGDLDYLRRFWEPIERAWRFCLETDRDGDGLIENSRVGHGWIEHGPLGGAHVTLYLASVWIAAMEALEPVADAVGRPELAADLRERIATGRAALGRRFRHEGRYALGVLADGTLQMHRTAMLSVPLLLGVVPPDEAGEWYEAIAGPGFSAPWGVRMLATDDPLFEADGYHRGAVWPLYTGWVSLAEWRGGRYPEALRHLRANAALAKERAKGAFDEVLHGLEPRAAGVCPDQAWSAAMVLAPAVEGLWGVVPDALSGAVEVAPWLPAEWDRMALRRLRVGRTVLDIELRRRPEQLAARVRRLFGPGIQLTLRPRLGRPASAVLVDGTTLGGGQARFMVDGEHEVVFFE